MANNTQKLKPRKGYLTLSDRHGSEVLFKARLNLKVLGDLTLRAGRAGDTSRPFVKPDAYVFTPSFIASHPVREQKQLLGALSPKDQDRLVEFMARNVWGQTAAFWEARFEEIKQGGQ